MAVSNDLILNVTPSEIAIALLEEKQLLELNKEKSNLQFSVGDIYLGKVKKIMPGLNAAFVDVGYEKDAFLHYLDLGPQFKTLCKYVNVHVSRKGKPVGIASFKAEQDLDKNGKITDVLTSGQVVMVQIAKEPISTKGPRLGSEISIAGRNMVLIPFSNKISISQKISSNEEKKRLKRLMQSIIPEGFGVIMRTAAEGKKVAVLDAELQGLIKKWESAFEKFRSITIPSLLVSEIDRTSAILRDLLTVSFSNIWINDEAIFHDIRSYIATIAPEKEKIVKLYTGGVPIFEQFGIEKQIKALFGKTVSFKSGAYLIIEHTEALHVIDVNSGNRSKASSDQESNALDVNLAAADEIARQLRLRDMGGIIVVDFIDMHNPDNKQMLFDRMREDMTKDRAKHNILPLSKFGLMQITRQRVRPEMHIHTNEKCPTCNGTGEIGPSILFDNELETQIAYLSREKKQTILTLKVHPFVAGYLNKGMFSKKLQWSFKYHCILRVKPTMAYTFMEYHIFDRHGDELTY